jgi:hypothetical protein
MLFNLSFLAGRKGPPTQPCPNKIFGCKVVMKCGSHKRICPYRPVNCPDITCHNKVPLCEVI